MDTDRTDHVIEAIDNALAWRGPAAEGADWEADSMRWAPPEAEVHQQPEPPHVWPAQRRLLDMILYGNAYETADGERIDPRRVVVSHPRVQGARPDFVVVDEPDEIPSAVREIRPPIRVFQGVRFSRADLGMESGTWRDDPVGFVADINIDHSALRRSAHWTPPTFDVSPETAAALGRAFTRFGAALAPLTEQARHVCQTLARAQRTIDSATDHQPPTVTLSVRERALEARRNRNTGPARDPFPRRGR